MKSATLEKNRLGILVSKAPPTLYDVEFFDGKGPSRIIKASVMQDADTWRKLGYYFDEKEESGLELTEEAQYGRFVSYYFTHYQVKNDKGENPPAITIHF